MSNKFQRTGPAPRDPWTLTEDLEKKLDALQNGEIVEVTSDTQLQLKNLGTRNIFHEMLLKMTTWKPEK